MTEKPPAKSRVVIELSPGGTVNVIHRSGPEVEVYLWDWGDVADLATGDDASRESLNPFPCEEGFEGSPIDFEDGVPFVPETV